MSGRGRGYSWTGRGGVSSPSRLVGLGDGVGRKALPPGRGGSKGSLEDGSGRRDPSTESGRRPEDDDGDSCSRRKVVLR